MLPKNIPGGKRCFAPWALLVGLLPVVTSCASVNGFAWNYEIPSFADRVGMHGCAISVPLTSNQVLEGSRLMGNLSPETHGGWVNMKEEFREGDQFRYVNCSVTKGAMGTDFFVLLRNDVIVSKFTPVIY